MIYFDHNATTPLHSIAEKAWLSAARDFPGNSSSQHRVGARAEAALAEARESLARILGCSPLDILFTSGASESNNTVFHHLATCLPADAEIWISAVEHPSVTRPAVAYFKDRVRLIPVNRDGLVQLDWLEQELSHSRPGLVAVMAANNESGVLQPWGTALALCQKARVPFFCDAVQWIGKLPAAGFGRCDFMSGSAHKFGGPKGVGFLKCPTGQLIAPLIYGGPHQDGRRAGTENVASVLAMLAMLENRETVLANHGHESREHLRISMELKLLELLPRAQILGAGVPRLWNTLSFLMPESNCRQRWVVKLDKLGYAVSTGSACASGKEAPSHVLEAMGYSAAESARVLRFSSGWETTANEWEDLLRALKQVVSSSPIAPDARFEA